LARVEYLYEAKTTPPDVWKFELTDDNYLVEIAAAQVGTENIPDFGRDYAPSQTLEAANSEKRTLTSSGF
jgi:hypothetical protein